MHRSRFNELSLTLLTSCLLLTRCVSSSIHATPSAVAVTHNSTLATSAPNLTKTPLHIAGELHLAIHEDIKTLNPYLTSNASEEFIISLLYDTLLSEDSRGNLNSNLAKLCQLTSGGTTLTCWLNPQAKWHNGQPVTAQDVVFSFNFARKNQFPGLARIVAAVDRAEVTSPDAVKFILLNTQADVMRLLCTKLRVIPSELWANVSDPFHYANLDNPIGSGPFRFEKHVKGEQIILSNTRVYHTARPYIDTIVLKIFPDESQALQTLKDGQLDMLGWGITPELASDVRDNPERNAGIKVAEAPATFAYTLLFNLRKSPYDSQAFRQALAQAIDTQAVIDEVLNGFGDVATPALFQLASNWQNPNIAPITFDPQGTIEKLKAAKFLDRNGDGARENPDGTALHVSLTCENLPISQRIARLVAANWQAVGIATEVTTIAQDLMIPTLMQANFDVILHTISLNEPEIAFFCFHTLQGLIRNGRVIGLNYGGYTNPEYDEAFHAFRAEQDSAKRQKLLYQLQEILAADLPQIPLCSPYILNLYRDDRFTAWKPEPGVGLLSRATMMNLRVVSAEK